MHGLILLFVLSGAAGLMYEVVWTRALADVVGSAAVSTSAVFSCFLASLALGAWAFGRRDRPASEAILTYAKLELSVAVAAAVASGIILIGRDTLAAWGPTSSGTGAMLAFSVLLSAALMGPPTVLMGGTLPVIIQAAAGGREGRTVAPMLYGWNTLGAALGTLLAGFVLIWRLGLQGTVAVAVVLYLGVALAAITLRSRLVLEGPPRPSAESETQAADPTWLTLAFVSGFLILTLEVLWGRVSRFILGDRTMAVAALLFVFVASLGIAAIAAPSIGRMLRVESRRKALWALGVLFLSGGGLHLIAIPLAGATVSGGGLGSLMGTGVWGRLVVITLLLGPPVVVLGGVLPLLFWTADRINARPGRVVGGMYLANTSGAVIGAWVAVFLLSGWLGTMVALRVMTAGTLGFGGFLLAKHGRRRSLALGAGLALLGSIVAFVLPGSLVLVRSDELLVASAEDAYGVQVLAETDQGRMRVRNNRLNLIFDLGHPQTDHAQQMAAHWSMLLAGEAETVVNIGTGYGITAGTFTIYPEPTSLDTVELLPFLVRNLNRFQAHNFDFTADPRITVRTGDGRRRLAVSPDTYDVISVNVLDPYLPGSASLYTTDFWELARSRLNPGGVFTQLFWGDDVDLLVRGLNTVFSTALYFPAYGGTSYNVVAFRDPIRPNELALRLDRLSELASAEIERLEAGDPETVLPSLLSDAWRLRRELNARASLSVGPLHTDDRPVLEYRLAHGVAGVSVFDSPLVQ